jgi:hypothetical protein
MASGAAAWPWCIAGGLCVVAGPGRACMWRDAAVAAAAAAAAAAAKVAIQLFHLVRLLVLALDHMLLGSLVP